MSIDSITTLLNRSQKPNRCRREDAEAFFNARVEIWYFADLGEVDFTLILKRGANLVLQFVKDARVAEEIVGQSSQGAGGCFAAGNTGYLFMLAQSASFIAQIGFLHEKSSVDDNLILREIIVLRLFKDVVDEIFTFTLGVFDTPR